VRQDDDPKYRRAAALGLKELLSRFNCQEVAASLFDYQKFAAAHSGVKPKPSTPPRR
jgi:hypothetical protein